MNDEMVSKLCFHVVPFCICFISARPGQSCDMNGTSTTSLYRRRLVVKGSCYKRSRESDASGSFRYCIAQSLSSFGIIPSRNSLISAQSRRCVSQYVILLVRSSFIADNVAVDTFGRGFCGFLRFFFCGFRFLQRGHCVAQSLSSFGIIPSRNSFITAQSHRYAALDNVVMTFPRVRRYFWRLPVFAASDFCNVALYPITFREIEVEAKLSNKKSIYSTL